MSKIIKRAMSKKITSLINKDHRLGEMLSYSAGRLVIDTSMQNRGRDWQVYMNNLDYSAIVEWLKFSIKNDAPWLNDVDNKGRPKKLMSFKNLAETHSEIRRDMQVATQHDGKVISAEGETLDIKNLPEKLKVIGFKRTHLINWNF